MDSEATQHTSALPHRRRGSRLAKDLWLLAIIGVLLLAATGAAWHVLYREYHSASAFVGRYLGHLAAGEAADALRLPGVALEQSAMSAAGIDADAHDVLLRSSVLAPLEDIRLVGEHAEGEDTIVTAQYTVGGHPGSTDFRVRQSGWLGIAPQWYFSQSPIAVIALTVRGSDAFIVNGLELDRRQIAVTGLESDPLDPVPLLVFSPGMYAVSVDTAISETGGVSVLADVPLLTLPIDVQADPTDEFIEVVQERVNEFLQECTTQAVLQPTGCPFGYPVQDRVESAPQWSLSSPPRVSLVPDGAGWRIPESAGSATITVDIKSLFDGTVYPMVEPVPFVVTGSVTILPDGSASIRVGAPEDGATAPEDDASGETPDDEKPDDGEQPPGDEEHAPGDEDAHPEEGSD